MARESHQRDVQHRRAPRVARPSLHRCRLPRYPGARRCRRVAQAQGRVRGVPRGTRGAVASRGAATCVGQEHLAKGAGVDAAAAEGAGDQGEGAHRALLQPERSRRGQGLQDQDGGPGGVQAASHGRHHRRVRPGFPRVWRKENPRRLHVLLRQGR